MTNKEQQTEEETMERKFKVFEIDNGDGCDWIISKTKKQALDFYKSQIDDPEDDYNVKLLTDSDLKEKTFYYEGSYDGKTGTFLTRYNEVIKKGINETDWFASSEF